MANRHNWFTKAANRQMETRSAGRMGEAVGPQTRCCAACLAEMLSSGLARPAAHLRFRVESWAPDEGAS